MWKSAHINMGEALARQNLSVQKYQGLENTNIYCNGPPPNNLVWYSYAGLRFLVTCLSTRAICLIIFAAKNIIYIWHIQHMKCGKISFKAI